MSNKPIDIDLSPEERLNDLINFTSTVEIDPNVNAKLYYRSGLNMFKQFNIYYKEFSWENALCIYVKYELLFFDKIKKHPGYNQIPVNVKSVNAANFRLMKLYIGHVQRELFKQYNREYMSYCDELKRSKGNEVIEDIKALEHNKASQTVQNASRGRSRESVKNAKKSSTDRSKSIIEGFRPKISIKSSRGIDSKSSFQVARSLKGSDLFRSKTTASSDFSAINKTNGYNQGSKIINVGGSELFKTKSSKDAKLFESRTTSLRGNNDCVDRKLTATTLTEPKQTFEEIVRKLEGVEKGTYVSGITFKSPGRKKTKDHTPDGASINNLNAKGVFKTPFAPRISKKMPRTKTLTSSSEVGKW